MGICNSCIYKGERFEGGCRRRHLNDFQCTNPSNGEVDFVTGAIIYGSCRNHNQFGNCKHFDDGAIPFYAWKNDEDIVYTKTLTPFADEEYFITPGEDADGNITSSNILYAWKNKDLFIYTISETPDVLDKVYSLNGIADFEIESTGANKITVDGKDYSRSAADDVTNAFVIIDSKNYYRNENYDTRYLEEQDGTYKETE